MLFRSGRKELVANTACGLIQAAQRTDWLQHCCRRLLDAAHRNDLLLHWLLVVLHWLGAGLLDVLLRRLLYVLDWLFNGGKLLCLHAWLLDVLRWLLQVLNGLLNAAEFKYR